MLASEIRRMSDTLQILINTHTCKATGKVSVGPDFPSRETCSFFSLWTFLEPFCTTSLYTIHGKKSRVQQYSHIHE
jgi:hypothetical protein